MSLLETSNYVENRPLSEVSQHYLNLALYSQGYLPHGRYHKCTLLLRKATLLIKATIDHMLSIPSKLLEATVAEISIAYVASAMKINLFIKENLPKDC